MENAADKILLTSVNDLREENDTQYTGQYHSYSSFFFFEGFNHLILNSPIYIYADIYIIYMYLKLFIRNRMELCATLGGACSTFIFTVS